LGRKFLSLFCQKSVDHPTQLHLISVSVNQSSNLSNPMKKILLSAITAAAFAIAPNSYALLASDSANNYTTATWTNGANLGTGFGAWALSSGNGTGGFGGYYVTETANNNTPANAGITGMDARSFALYADPLGSGAFANADRSFSSSMAVGDTFSFQWGVNWDSGAGGNKGFNIYTGAPGTGEIVNVNNGGSSIITFNGSDTLFGFGTSVMTWSFTLTSASTLSVSANDRDGVGTFTTNLTVAAAPQSFRFYASGMQAGDQAKPYFNNLSVVPEPSTYALLALSAVGLAGYAARRRARK
jgi:hypothetical protein